MGNVLQYLALHYMEDIAVSVVDHFGATQGHAITTAKAGTRGRRRVAYTPLDAHVVSKVASSYVTSR